MKVRTMTMAVTIKYVSRELTKVEQYRMTLDNAIISCKDIPDGTEIEIDAFCEFEDVKDNGESDTVFSILATDGTVYAATSKTFARNVREIADVFEGDKFTIKKMSGKTKAGKDFIYACLSY